MKNDGVIIAKQKCKNIYFESINGNNQSTAAKISQP